MSEIIIQNDSKLDKILLILQQAGAALVNVETYETEITAMEGYKDMILFELHAAQATIKDVITY